MATLSGNIKNLGIVNETSLRSFVRFTLINIAAGQIARVTGNIVVGPYIDFTPDSSGNLSGNIQGNDTITPASTRYLICVFEDGVRRWCDEYEVTGASFDLDAATPFAE